MASRTYTVKVSHPTGYHSGIKTLTVTDNYGKPTVYVTGSGFGCSRDYPGAAPGASAKKVKEADMKAIRLFLYEHACEIV